MRFGSAPILTNGSMSTGATSFGIDLQQEWAFSIQAVWTSTSSASQSGLGTLRLQASNDNAVVPMSGPPGTDPAINVVNWVDVSGTFSSTSLSTGTSNFMYNVSFPGYRWVRLVYTAASGTGIMSASYFGKGS